MGYFRELPELDYQSFLSDSNSSQNYLRVKNLFRRNKLRDDLQNVFTLFNKYEIVEGARPDTVAEEIYGSATLDWVVLMTAGIINVRDEWPLSNYQLYKYAENKYGIAGLNDIHHYETKEVKDSNGRLILPAGKVVDEDFSLTNNLAADHPEKVKEMQDLFEKEAIANNVYPLDDRLYERFNAAIAGRPDLMGDRKSLSLADGMDGILENTFLNVKNT